MCLQIENTFPECLVEPGIAAVQLQDLLQVPGPLVLGTTSQSLFLDRCLLKRSSVCRRFCTLTVKQPPEFEFKDALIFQLAVPQKH